MIYRSICKVCRRVRELTEEAFKRFLPAEIRASLEQRERAGNATSAKLEFLSGCPDCVGWEGASEVRLVVGKKPPPH